MKMFAEILRDEEAAAELFDRAVDHAGELLPRALKAFLRGAAGGAGLDNDDFLRLEALEYLHDNGQLKVCVVRNLSRFLQHDEAAAELERADIEADARGGETDREIDRMQEAKC